MNLKRELVCSYMMVPFLYPLQFIWDLTYLGGAQAKSAELQDGGNVDGQNGWSEQNCETVGRNDEVLCFGRNLLWFRWRFYWRRVILLVGVEFDLWVEFFSLPALCPNRVRFPSFTDYWLLDVVGFWPSRDREESPFLRFLSLRHSLVGWAS